MYRKVKNSITELATGILTIDADFDSYIQQITLKNLHHTSPTGYYLTVHIGYNEKGRKGNLPCIYKQGV